TSLFLSAPSTSVIYPLSLHDALPILDSTLTGVALHDPTQRFSSATSDYLDYQVLWPRRFAGPRRGWGRALKHKPVSYLQGGFRQRLHPDAGGQGREEPPQRGQG